MAIDRRKAEHSSLTPSQRSQRAKIAAQTRWAHQDGAQGTQAARERFMQRFIDEVDPDRELAPAVRLRRAESAKRAYFQRLAFHRHKSK